MQRDASDPQDALARDVLDTLALERLAFVARAGDPTLVARLVDLFLEDTPDRLHSLYTASANQDAAAVRAVAHALRGSSETFGAHDMAEHCRFLEDIPHAWDDAAIHAHIDALSDAFDRTRTALETVVRDQPQAI